MEQDKFEVYENWLNEQGVIRNPKFIFPFLFPDFSIGVCASEKIEPNECLLLVPWDLVINSKQIYNCDLKLLFEKYPQLASLAEDSHLLILTIFLLIEYFKGDSSCWRPYFDCISADLPLMWSVEEVQCINDSELATKLAETKADLCTYFVYLKKVLVSEKLLPSIVEFDNFLLLYCYVLSRNFAYSSEESIIIPFADSLNHENVQIKYELFDGCNGIFDFDNFENEEGIYKPTNLNFCDYQAKRYFSMSTGNNQTFERNCQVYNCYGAKTNKQLLKWYGFCLRSNEHDCFSFKLRIENEEENEFVRKIKDSYNTKIKDNSVVIKFKLFKKEAPLELLRYCWDYMQVENNESTKSEAIEFCLQLLERLLILKRYEEHEQDCLLLQRTDVPIRKRMATIYKVTARELLFEKKNLLEKGLKAKDGEGPLVEIITF